MEAMNMEERRTTRWCVISVVTVTAALVVTQSAQAEDRALLVGVGAYERQSPFRDLFGIERDLATMQEVAGELGFEESQIRVLADEEATLAGIRSAFESWLIDAVGPGERALFYFSGHGYHVIDRDDDEPDGEDEVLVPHDYAGTAQALTNVVVDDDMAAWIGRLRTDDVLIFLDACHSGSAVKSTAGTSGWSMFDGDGGKGVSTKSAAGADAGYLALSAARDWEQALATQSGSTFTVGIGRAVRDAASSESPLTMNGIREMAAAEIARAHPTRLFHPVLSGDLSRADRDLRRRPSPTRSLWDRLVEATNSASSRRIDVSGVQSVYRAGDEMTFEVVMPADGYLNVVSVEEDSDDAAVLFPNPWSPRRFAGGERVHIPYRGGVVVGEILMRFNDPIRLGEEHNLLVVVVSEGPLDLHRRGVEAVVPLLDGFYRSGVPYVVRR